MKIPFLLSMAALAVTLTGGALHEAQARGLGGVRGGVGGFGGGSIQARPATGGAGGFSRGGPAASGSFSGSAATSANRNQTAQTASANRAATRQSRQATTTVNQSQRQSTVQSTQSGYYGAGYRAPAAAGYYRPPAAVYAPATAWFDAGLGEVVRHGFGHSVGTAGTDRHLQGAVTVGGLGLDLSDAIGLDLNEGDGNRYAVFRK